jgi:microsomal dipeptidase-like Zn-dependent dipeptidase
MHCDLLVYLATTPHADPENSEDIGCALPLLSTGNVKLQVLAIYTAVEPGSTKIALKESCEYQQLIHNYDSQVLPVQDLNTLDSLPKGEKIGVLAAVENAAGFCEEDDDLAIGFERLEKIIRHVGNILYITVTHHTENRFGGGNFSDNVGLKPDGEALLDYLDGRKIAVDFSHMSDALALGILDYITKQNLHIPVLASHSNFRKVWDHKRNLPDEIAAEIVHRRGIIGMNFIRAFVDDTKPEALGEHIFYGLDHWGDQALCFGADYFYAGSHPDQTRQPFYFKEHGDASLMPEILEKLSANLSAQQLQGLAYQNAMHFMRRIWA